MDKYREMLGRVFSKGEEHFRKQAENASTSEERQSYQECADACERLAPKLLSLLDKDPTMQGSNLLGQIAEYPEHKVLVEQRLLRSAVKTDQEG